MKQLAPRVVENYNLGVSKISYIVVIGHGTGGGTWTPMIKKSGDFEKM